MLIIPVDRKPDWKRPPLVTILLVLINLLIYFGIQWHERSQMEPAAHYYLVESRLPEFEFPAYARYLESDNKPEAAAAMRKGLELWQRLRARTDLAVARDGKTASLEYYEPLIESWYVLDADLRFAALMQQAKPAVLGTIAADDLAEWKEQRDHYVSTRKRSFTERYSLIPAQAFERPITLLTHMFLHASVEHVLGNMVFLAMVGYAVEILLGGGWYLLFYLLSGLLSAAFYLVFRGDSMILSLGASGAISGVMGMYTVLYGLRKIRFFYWFVFYFDFFKAPALIMLPIWVGKEAFDLWFGAPSNTNYYAHIGGLLGGALLALVYRLLARRKLEQAHATYVAPADDDKQLLSLQQSAYSALSRLDFERARRDFSSLVRRTLAQQKTPQPDWLLQLFNLSKQVPAAPVFHKTAEMLLRLPKGSLAEDKIHQVYLDYVARAEPRPQLSSEQSLAAAKRFALNGQPQTAAAILQILMVTARQHQQLPQLVQFVARGFMAAGMHEKAQHYQKMLQQQFPLSEESRLATSPGNRY
ncbi:rhomboid family intramembrane serine protease [Collimonas sp. OK412]|jgi:membrane associated rhomboid family serine protease|uniref:rhomboid family intramembrane serine protease n=1 Tax=Collimonas sp. (strain OK412) TaxID=1801619 RepID=UPI0008F0E973|nr:rhomboid family intramembrane serine protease [Collimonas sp. OK412]SFC36629.1 Rhomboid family protein [Collimonas sp. OK412]